MTTEIKDVGLHEDGSFRFQIPATFKKSKDGRVEIEGVASVETPDLQGETVLLRGMDLNYFTKRGFFNDNHTKETDGKVGVPTEARVIKDGNTHKLFVKGYMLDTPRAEGIVKLAEALNKSGNARQLGFSIEGKVRERDGRIVSKSWLKDIAITAEPIHPDTYLNIVKSLSAKIVEQGYIDENGIEKSIGADGTEFWTKLGDTVSKSVGAALVELKKTLPVQKALEAGIENPPKDGGSALRVESLEGDLKDEDIPLEEAEGVKVKKVNLTKSQAAEIIKARGYSQVMAEKMADMLFDDQFRRFLQR